MAKKFDLKAEVRTYRRLISYARPYSWRLALGLLFGVVFGGSTTGLLAAFQKNLAQMFDPASLPWATLVLVAASLPVCALLRGLGDYLSSYYVEWVGNRVVMDIRGQTFSHVQDLSLGYFTASRTGELISRITNDTMMVQRAVSTVVGDLVRQPFVLIGAVIYLLWLNAGLAVVGLVLFPICIIPVAIFGRRVRRSSKEGQQRLADIVSLLQETISGVRIVKAFCTEEYEKKRFNECNSHVFGRLMRVARAQAAVEPIIVFVSFLGLALVLLYARWSEMSADAFITYAAALVVMYQPVKNLSKIHLNIQQSCAAADRIFEVLDTPVTVQERRGAKVLSGPVRDLNFEKVTFAYGDEPVLRDINLKVKAGECIALVGSSGSGKTTLVSLIPRFFDVTSGRILLNDLDLRDLTLNSLRRQIGVVSQETVLFNDTVAKNICYGTPAATVAEIQAAARRAHAEKFILELPDGYETVIGERGTRLSGGQRQRLAIARAILRNPPILILDEATSALDTESERQVQAALEELMTDRTVFAIAHRLSTIIRADRILVLDKGQIVESGTHQDLLTHGGMYSYLYNLQFVEHGGGKV